MLAKKLLFLFLCLLPINLIAQNITTVNIHNGGTGANTAAGAWANLFTGAGIAANCPVLATASNGAITCSSFTGLPSGWTATGSGSSQVVTAPGTFAVGTPIAPSITLDGSTGNGTFSGTVTAGAVNSIVSSCSYAGATADVQITAALADISSGGTVDARCYGALTIYIAAQVHVAPGSMSGPSQTLLFDPATNVLPSTNSTNMFLKGPNGTIKGLHTTFPSTAAYTGKEITINENSIDGATGGVEDFNFNVSAESAEGQPGGYGIYVSSTASYYGIAFIPFKHIRCYGGYRCIYISASSNGWVNDNIFEDVQATGSGAGIELNATGNPTLGNAINNTFFGYTYENPSGIGGVGILYSGTSFIQNSFIGGGASIDGTGAVFQNTNTFAASIGSLSYFSPIWGNVSNNSFASGTATNGTATTSFQTNSSLLNNGVTSAGENLTGYGFGVNGAGGNYYQQGAAFGAYLKTFNTAGFKWYCMYGSNNPSLCATLDPSGNFLVPGSMSSPAIIPTNITPSTSPVCANGTGGALTTTGCAGGSGSYLPLTGGTLTGALSGTSASFSGNVAAGAVNGVYSVAQFPGADVGAKINACLAALPSGKGTCDTRGLGTGVFPMAQITIGNGQKLQCDFGQEFQPTTAAETMVIQNNNSIITGCWFDASNQAAFSGEVISYTDNYRDGSQTTLEHSKLTAYPVRTGTAIYISATNAATQSIYTVAFNDVTIEGFQYGRYLTATTTGFINSVSFNGVQDSYSIIGTEINPTSTGLIARNNFIADNFQALIPGDIGIQIDGAGTWQQNYWTNLSIWDTNNGIVINNTTTNAGNFFFGSFDGYAVTDPTGTNTFCNQYNGVCKYGNTITLEASSIRSFGSVGGANLYAGGVLPFASQSEAMAGFNASTGNGEADWYTGLYTGASSYAHQWWAPNSSGTAWQSLMTLNDSGTLTPIGGLSTPILTVGSITSPAATSATDSASLGPELTTSGTCSGTGWTGTYPNYVAPGTTAPLTCTGFTSGSFYQISAGITGNTGSGTVTVAIGTAQTYTSSTAASSTLTFSPKANGTSLTYTPTAAFNGTIAISAKKINPITTFSYTGKDSTGAVSTTMLYQGLASLHNIFEGGGGTYNTTGSYNSAQGYNALYSNTTGNYNSAQGYNVLYSNTTGNYNSAQGYQAGQFISDGSTANATSSNSVYLGANTEAKASGDTNENVIGNGAVGNGSNTSTVGNTATVGTWLNGTQHITATAPITSAGTIAAYSTNAGGEITGLSAATSVTITFANSGWTNAAFCTANASTTLATNVYNSAQSNTAVTFTFPSLTGNLFYHCEGN
jgi:hypothetical protein